MGARVSEYTHHEPRGTDHCVRVDDLTFTVEIDGEIETIVGSRLGSLNLVETAKGLKRISEFRVLGTSSKSKVLVKPKHLDRRSVEEEQFLEDIATYVAKSASTCLQSCSQSSRRTSCI